MNSRKGDECATSFMKRTLNWKRWIIFFFDLRADARI
jgi:hypothetical protein